VALGVVRGPQLVHAGQHGAEPLAVVGHAADGNAAEADAVVALLAADQARALALAARAVVGERDLQRGVHRLRAGVGEEDMLERVRRDRRQPLGEHEGQGMAHLEGGREIHGRDLPLHRLDDARAGMAGVAAPQPGRAVEDLAAVAAAVVHVLRTDQHARLALELPVGAEGHPEGVHRLRSVGGLRFVKRAEAALGRPVVPGLRRHGTPSVPVGQKTTNVE